MSKKPKKHGRAYKDHYYSDPIREDNYWDLYERNIRGDNHHYDHHKSYYDDYRDEWDNHYPSYYGSSSHHHALWKADDALEHPHKSTYRYRDDWSGYDDHHLWRDDYTHHPYSDHYGHDDLALNAKIDHAVKKELGEALGPIDKQAENTVKKLDKALKK